MNSQHIIHIPGIATGGLLAAAFVSAAVTFAQTYDIRPSGTEDSFSPNGSDETFKPIGTEEVTGFYGMTTSPPSVNGSVQGTQEFDVYDANGQQVGSFDAFTSNNFAPGVTGWTNEELFVTKVVSGTPGTGPEDVPQVGSVFDTLNGGPTFGNSYSDFATMPVPAPGQPGDTVSDTLTTIFGPYAFPAALDASAHADPHTNVGIPLPLADGYSIVADPDSQETLTGVNGLPPLTVTVSGDGQQLFDVVNPAGSTVAKFTADVTTTGDGAAGYSEALLVTSDAPGSTVGTDPGDAPAPGSVFNILFFFNPDIYSMYSDLASTTPGGENTISDTLYDFGQTLNIPTTFDAVKGLTDGTPLIKSIPFGDSLKIVPASTETYSGINDVPPLSLNIQGYQAFNVDDSDGNVLATFKADETTYANAYGEKGEALLVTQDLPGGSTPADAPPVGSWIEYTNYGDGFATAYTDLTGQPHDTITETVITPFGDFNMPTTVDAALGLGDLNFFVP